MSRTHVSEAMRAAVGRRMGRRVSYPVSEADIRKWALAVYYPESPPRAFVDAEFAATTRWGGMIAPEDFNPFSWSSAEIETSGVVVDANDPDKTELTLGVEGPHLTHQLNGGIEVAYGVPMRPGDVITSVSRLAEYREREGRLGLMLFTVSEDVWTNQRGETVKRSRQTLIRY